MLAEKPVQASGVSTASRWVQLVPSLYTIAAAAVLGGVLLVALARPLDTDLWWHLRVGQYIFSHHTVPTHDFLSFTSAGHAWTDHEWLCELLMYSLYRALGMWGPIAFFAAVICATSALVYVNMVERGVNRVLALLVVIAGFVASAMFWGARPQMLTLFFLACYTLAYHRFRATRSRRLLVLFPALMLVWVNVHGGFILGLAFLGMMLAGELLNAVTRHRDSLSRRELRGLALTLLATVAVTAANPSGIREVLYPLVWLLPSPWANLITEWVPVDFHLMPMMVFEAMILALIGAAAIARPRVDWAHVLLVLAFTHLALNAVRNVPVWVVVISPLLGLYLQPTGPALRREFRWRRRPGRDVPKAAAAGLNLTLLAMLCVVYLFEGAQYLNPRMLSQNEAVGWPVGAIAYMQRHALPPRVFASYTWGGYVLWNLYPRYRDFIDGRANTLYTSRLLVDYLAVYDAQSGWRTRLSRYGVQDILVEPAAPLAQALRHVSTWELRYRDAGAVLYVRRGARVRGRE